MPPVIVAVAAAAAGAAATAAIGSALAATTIGATIIAGSLTVGSVLATIGGAIVAIGVSYAASAILGLNKKPENQNRNAQVEGQDRRQMVRSAVEPRRVVYGFARASGPLIYATSTGPSQEYLHVVVPIAAHPIHRFVRYVVNDVVIDAASLDASGMVTTGPLAGKCRLRGYDGRQTAADPDLVAETADGWSPSHIGFGVAYIYARLQYDQDAFPQGLQNIAADVFGRADLFNPVDGTTAYAENSAICILDYLRAPFGLACTDDEIDLASFAVAANICQEPVQISADGATQPRYALGGSFSLDRTPIDIMDDLLATCGGTLVYVQGRYQLHVAAYSTPTDTLTVSDLAGNIELVTRPPRRELFNSVRGTFIEPARGFQAADFPPVTEAAFVAEDGETIYRDISLPFVNDGIRAQRLARLALRRARESLTVRVPVRYAGIRYSTWQMLSVTVSDFGWSAKPFRVTSWQFDPQSGIVTLELREEGAASYAWDFEEANSYGPAPNTNLVSPFVIPAVAGLAVTEELYVTSGGTVVATRARLTWAAAAHPFVTDYEVQFRAANNNVWRTAAFTRGELVATIDDIPPELYVFRVRARTSVAAGAWAELQARIGGLIAQPPADLTGLAVQTIGGMAYLRWDQHPDVDVRVGGRIEFRHTPDTSGATWVGSTGIGDAAPGAATWTVLPLKPGTYLAKAVDQGGNYAVNAASVLAAQDSVLTWSSAATVTEHTAFSGTKTNAIVSSSTLRLDSSGDIDSEADFDAIDDLDGLGGVLPEGSYAFNGSMNLTAVKKVRVTTLISAVINNTFDQVDARPALVDDWLNFDGELGGEADAWVEMRTTSDNPSGSPTWSAWRRVDASEVEAWGIQFRAQLRSFDPAFNIHVSELSAEAEEVA